MYNAKVISPTGDEYTVSASTEFDLHRKVQKIVGHVPTKNFTVTPLRGGHTRISGCGWVIILYCSGR